MQLFFLLENVNKLRCYHNDYFIFYYYNYTRNVNARTLRVDSVTTFFILPFRDTCIVFLCSNITILIDFCHLK